MCSLEKRGNLWILTLTGDDQNRLNPNLISSLLSTLTTLSSQSTPGSVLITTATGTRFFSNGFDLLWARSATSPSAATERLHSMVQSLKPVAAALTSLPMPTIAAINGHASAAGFLLAICHDYVLMRSDQGVLYMPEVNLGLPLPDYFAAVFREKIKSPVVLRDVLLGGVKIKGCYYSKVPSTNQTLNLSITQVQHRCFAHEQDQSVLRLLEVAPNIKDVL